MTTNAADAPGGDAGIVQSDTDMMAQFGMVGNDQAADAAAHAADVESGAADETLSDEDFSEQVSLETTRLLNNEGLDDNLEALERREKVSTARAANAATAAAAANGGTDEGVTGADVPGDETGEATDPPVDPPADAPQDPPVDPPADAAGEYEAPTVTEAQSYLEYLSGAMGDELRFTYKAGGEVRTATINELKQHAAGYIGQAAVHKTLEEATAARDEGKRLRAEAEEIVGKQKFLVECIDDPKKFIADLVLAHADDPMKYLQDFIDAAQPIVDDLARDPKSFHLQRQLDQISRKLDGTAAATGATRSEAAPAAAAAAPVTTIPKDYGFVAGSGYAKEYAQFAMDALDVATKAAGKDQAFVDTVVIPKWKAEGQRESLFDVFLSVVTATAADAPKAAAAAAPPIPPRPRVKSGPTGKTKAPAAQGGESWTGIEKKLATSIRDAQRSGRV